MQIEGSLTALIDLSSVAFDPHFSEKLVGIAGYPVLAGTTQSFKVRFEFETQPWD